MKIPSSLSGISSGLIILSDLIKQTFKRNATLCDIGSSFTSCPRPRSFLSQFRKLPNKISKTWFRNSTKLINYFCEPVTVHWIGFYVIFLKTRIWGISLFIVGHFRRPSTLLHSQHGNTLHTPCFMTNLVNELACGLISYFCLRETLWCIFVH